MDKKIEEKTKDINEKIQKLDLAIQELIETTDNFFINDKYYGIECAFILDHALNIKMHFFNKYPAFALFFWNLFTTESSMATDVTSQM